MITNDYYGVPDWLMVEYLSELGGVEIEKFVMQGDGWTARIRKAIPTGRGVLIVGGATVEFTGDADSLDALFSKLHIKTLRGGG